MSKTIAPYACSGKDPGLSGCPPGTLLSCLAWGMQPEDMPNVGDPSKARRELGWEAAVPFEALIERMVRADLRSLEALPSTG